MTGDELGDLLVSQTKGYVEKALAPMLARLDVLERRFDTMPVPKDGKDADGEEVAAKVLDAIAGDLDELRKAIAEPLPDFDEIARTVAAEEIAKIPAPKDGKDADTDEVAAKVVETISGDLEELRKAIAEVPQPEPLPDLDAMVKAAAAEEVAKIPAPKDGEKGDKGDPGEKGADGLGLAGAFIDREGALTITMTNGETKALGPVVGKDGTPGQPGEDGKDALGFDDMRVEFDGQRTVKFTWQGADRTVEKAMTFPVPIYEGVFTNERTYAEGAAVTSGGSVWIAQNDTSEIPGTGKAWRLAVKKGRDGKDGVMETPPEPKTVKAGK